MTNQMSQIRAKAIDYLSRREHSHLELQQKLLKKGFAMEDIQLVLQQLGHDNLLSEERFMDSFIYSRQIKGYGPLRIQQELRQRGIAKEVILATLNINDDRWQQSAIRVKQKRFGAALPNTPLERQKQSRFLFYRGFTNAQIKIALSTQDVEESDER